MTIKCLEKCLELQVDCPCEDCRYWIDYPSDYNCVFRVIANNNENPMTYKEIGKRLGYTHSRIIQIERCAVDKINRRNTFDDFLE